MIAEYRIEVHRTGDDDGLTEVEIETKLEELDDYLLPRLEALAAEAKEACGLDVRAPE